MVGPEIIRDASSILALATHLNIVIMQNYTVKIESISHLEGHVNSQENSGYKRCKRTDYDICLGITYKDKLTKEQKKVYYKTHHHELPRRN